jgi:hypothetical protein
MTTTTTKTTATQARAQGRMTIWERLGAAEGLWAVLLLAVQAALLMQDPIAWTAESDAQELRDHRMAYEAATFLRVVAGLMIVWFAGSLAARLRSAEGTPGRLASIALAVCAAWGVLWLLSALFNSASILLATEYDNDAGSVLAGVLARETVYVLGPGIAVVTTLCVSFVAARFGGFPRWYGPLTFGACGLLFVLAVADWWGAFDLSLALQVLAHAWLALTSVVLMREPPRGRAA